MAKRKHSPGSPKVPASPGAATAAAKSPPVPAPRTVASYWQPALLVVLAFFVYCNALYDGFVWDDGRQVLQNPYIRDTRHLSQIFTTDVWSFRSLEQRSNYYRPMMHLVYMATYHLFGLQPGGFHAVNMLFHAADTLLVYFLIGLLFRRRGLAFLSALLFATHPIHTEAVIWVASLPEVSVTFFYLAALILYVLPESLNRPAGRYRIGSLLAFFLALLSKEMAVTLPLVIMAYEVVYRKATLRNAVLAVIPYAAPVAVYMAMRLHALGGLAAGDTHPEVMGLAYVWSVIVLVAKYVWKMLVPVPLNFFHLFEPNRSPLEPAVLGSATGLAALVWGAWRGRAAHPALSFGLAWILITLLPALGIKQVGENVFTERYLYLPSIGFCWVLVYGLTLLLERAAPLENRKPATVTLAVVAGLSALYAIATWARAEDYRNEIRLFTKTLAQSPGAVPIRNGLGTAYFNQRQYDLAEREFQEVLRYKPDSPEAHMNLGVGYYIKGQTEAAIREYRAALRYRPTYAEAHYNLGLAYIKMGAGKPALEEFQQAVQANPDYVKARLSLGAALRSEGRLDQALSEHQRALALRPDMVEAHVNLGLDYMAAGQFDRAAQAFGDALRLDPNYAEGYNYLGAAYAQQGRWDEAIRQYQQALQRKPHLAEARANLEQAMAHKGR